MIEAGNGAAGAGDGEALGEVQVGEVGFDVEADHFAFEDVGDEGQDGAKFGVLDGDHRADAAGTCLGHWVGVAAAGLEASGLAVERDEVRLGEDLGELVLSQGVDEEVELAGVEDAEELGGVAEGSGSDGVEAGGDWREAGPEHSVGRMAC